MTGVPRALVIRRTPLEWLILGITLLSLSELWYAPHLALLRDSRTPPAITLPGITASIAELAVMGFVALGIVLLLQRCTQRGAVDLGPKGANGLVAALIGVLLGSLLLGALLTNADLGRHVRVELLSPLLFLIFLNLPLRESFERDLWRLLVAGSTLLMLGSLLLYLIPQLIGVITVRASIYADWYALVITLLCAAVATARLLFHGYSTAWMLVAAAALTNVTLHLTAKPVVFGLIVIMLLLLGVALSCGRMHVIARAVAAALAIPALIGGALAVAPSSVQLDLTRTLAARFLKQTDVRDVADLKVALDVVTSGQGEDITEGRFDIWRTYLAASRYGYGFAPQGSGHQPSLRHEASGAVVPPHNIIVYYAYHGGLLASLLILTLIGWFFVKGFLMLVRTWGAAIAGIEDYALAGGYAFVLGTTAISFVTTSPHANDLRVGWCFWLVAVMLVRRIGVTTTRFGLISQLRTRA